MMHLQKQKHSKQILVPAWLALAITISTMPFALGQTKGDKAFGEYIASECVTCHQISGKQTVGIPAIIGLPEDQFVALLNSYKVKDRDNITMQTIAAKLSEQEMAALAAYFGSLKAAP